VRGRCSASCKPWGKDRGRQATLISVHDSVADAFAEIDRLTERILRTGDRPDLVELVVVDAFGNVVGRPGHAPTDLQAACESAQPKQPLPSETQRERQTKRFVLGAIHFCQIAIWSASLFPHKTCYLPCCQNNCHCPSSRKSHQIGGFR
jgi:hypothetical protein